MLPPNLYIAETGVQNLAFMIVAVNLVFRGCQQFQVMHGLRFSVQFLLHFSLCLVCTASALLLHGFLLDIYGCRGGRDS